MNEIKLKILKQCEHSVSYELSGFFELYENPEFVEKILNFPQMIQQSLQDIVVIVVFQLPEDQWDIPFQETELDIPEIRDSKGKLRKDFRVLAILDKYDLLIFKKIWEMSAISGIDLSIICIKKKDYSNNSFFVKDTFREFPAFQRYWGDSYALIHYNDKYLGKWRKSALLMVLTMDGDVLLINVTRDYQFFVEKIKDYFSK